jgi:TonB family protein
LSRFVPYVAFSVVVHGLLSLFIQHTERPEPVAMRQQPIEFVALETPKPEQALQEVETPEPEQAPPAQPATPRPEPRPAKATLETSQRPAEEMVQQGPVRLTGVKFSNSGTFALGSGTGQPAGSASPSRATAPTAGPQRSPSRLVQLSDLSKRPAPPKLDARLQANYPQDQRRMGIEGEALLELILSEQGKVVDAQIRDQTAPPFGAACRKTLMGTSWSQPLDSNGHAVRTRLSYRCSFRVADR